MTEYALLAALIAITGIVSISSLAETIKRSFLITACSIDHADAGMGSGEDCSEAHVLTGYDEEP